MTLALDADVLVNWQLNDTPFHGDASRLISREVQKGGVLGLVPQVLYEFLHVATDDRRMTSPNSMQEAIARTDALWDAPEVFRILPDPGVPRRVLELLARFGLGRKRVFDTVLAATLEAAIRRLATFNGRDYEIFSFLDIVTPS